MSCVKEKQLDLDDVLVKFDLWGKYHMNLLVWVVIGFIANAITSTNYVFAVESVKYRCVSENLDCQSNITCTEWQYERNDSFVAEFQLACQDWKRTLVGTAHSTGYMLGLLAVGPLSDRVGRKMAVVTTGVIGAVLGTAKSFSHNYWLYVTIEFLEAAFGDVCSPIYMLSIEMVSKENRVTFTNILNVGYAIGGAIMAAIAWNFQYWRSFLRVAYSPFVLMIFYIYLIDESPRWLLTKGRKDEAIHLIERAAKRNGIKIERHILDKLSSEREERSHLMVLLKDTLLSKALLIRFLVCVLWWTTSTFVNYGLFINSVSLQGNKYVNYAMVSVIDVPGVFLIMYILKNFDRKMPLICTFIAGAVLCFVQPFVPNSIPTLSITMYLVAKLMSSFYFNITYIFTSELFPTCTRNSMHALCSSLGRTGAILAPQTPLLMKYWRGLPSMIYSGMSLLAGLATLMVPDPANDSLPDTVLQAEVLGSKQSIAIENGTKPRTKLTKL